ncbi:MAG: hypothetical protein CMI56_01695 [Parcubacteria group bacterium]|nr:hypothetical protein [Parcubacteria group bacterium]|tara:strand:+ start:420 stop:893 length:474 start_codon:yes stop_codon:yes gene_type:complete
MEFGLIVALAIFFEILTVLFRLILKLQSKVVQKKFIRIHHGYIGMAVLLASFAMPDLLLWEIGWALIISDLVHHYTVLPLLKISAVDLDMEHYGISEIALRRKFVVALAALLVIGILASAATSVWVSLVALAMIIVSEELQELLPKFKLPQEVVEHF